jgi:hypothetical protein
LDAIAGVDRGHTGPADIAALLAAVLRPVGASRDGLVLSERGPEQTQHPVSGQPSPRTGRASTPSSYPVVSDWSRAWQPEWLGGGL